MTILQVQQTSLQTLYLDDSDFCILSLLSAYFVKTLFCSELEWGSESQILKYCTSLAEIFLYST